MPRARLRDLDLKVGTLPPGPFNAITDVPGVKVGYSTVIQDSPRVARTGVTAIWPRGPEIWTDYVFAGTFSFNGNGEMTGLPWLAEQGLLGAPIGITNTYQVGIVRDAITACRDRRLTAVTRDGAAGRASHNRRGRELDLLYGHGSTRHRRARSRYFGRCRSRGRED